MTIQNPTLSDLLSALENEKPDAIVPLQPDGNAVPRHYHVTEVARFQKDFIDCGGTVRRTRYAQLQLLFASDFDHRLAAGKLATIIRKSASLLGEDPLPLVLEYGQKVAVAYPVSSMSLEGGKLILRMENPVTACLASETCGLNEEESRVNAFRVASDVCSPGSGCC